VCLLLLIIDEPVNEFRLNPALAGAGLIDDPNRWQRLILTSFVDQSGIAADGYPPFTGPSWGFVRPFALTPSDASRSLAADTFDGTYFDPGPPPLIGVARNDGQYQANFTLVAAQSALLDATQPVWWSASPANATLGANNPPPHRSPTDCRPATDQPCRNVGAGHAFNPHTGLPYEENSVLRGDYTYVVFACGCKLFFNLFISFL
jgi:hypothetical protein